MILGFSTAVKVNTVVERIPVIFRIEESSFSPKLLEQEVIKMNLPHKNIVIAQFRLESNNFQSALFKQSNNFTGMKYSPKRINCQSGQIGEFATYSSWKDCLKDYAIYSGLYCRDLSDKQFLDFLGQVYCPDSGYVVSVIKNLSYDGKN